MGDKSPKNAKKAAKQKDKAKRSAVADAVPSPPSGASKT